MKRLIHAKKDLNRLLRSTALFQGLTIENAEKLLNYALLYECQRNEVVIHEGDTESTLYVIVQGRLSILRQDQSLGERTTGEFFGEMAVFTEEPRFASVIANTRCVLLELSRQSLLRCVLENPEIALTMIATLIRRHQYSDRQRLVAGTSVMQRVATYLLQQEIPQQVGLILPDQQYLADLLHTKRETINRVLRCLHNVGILTADTEASTGIANKNRVVITDHSRLIEAAAGAKIEYRATKKEAL